MVLLDPNLGRLLKPPVVRQAHPRSPAADLGAFLKTLLGAPKLGAIGLPTKTTRSSTGTLGTGSLI